MRIEINEQAWNRGFWDGDSREPSHACPYAVDADERLSWLSGYIEGKAFRNGYIATPPGSRVPLQKNALAAEPCAVPLRSSRRGGLLHRASHRTGHAGPHPAPWVDHQSASVSWSVTRGVLSSPQRALSETIRSRNHAGG